MAPRLLVDPQVATDGDASTCERDSLGRGGSPSRDGRPRFPGARMGWTMLWAVEEGVSEGTLRRWMRRVAAWFWLIPGTFSDVSALMGLTTTTWPPRRVTVGALLVRPTTNDPTENPPADCRRVGGCRSYVGRRVKARVGVLAPACAQRSSESDSRLRSGRGGGPPGCRGGVARVWSGLGRDHRIVGGGGTRRHRGHRGAGSAVLRVRVRAGRSRGPPGPSSVISRGLRANVVPARPTAQPPPLGEAQLDVSAPATRKNGRPDRWPALRRPTR